MERDSAFGWLGDGIEPPSSHLQMGMVIVPFLFFVSIII